MRGRPKVDDVSRRDNSIRVRLTYHEYGKVKHAASKYNCSLSDILRAGIYMIDQCEWDQKEQKVKKVLSDCKNGK